MNAYQYRIYIYIYICFRMQRQCESPCLRVDVSSAAEEHPLFPTLLATQGNRQGYPRGIGRATPGK